MRSLLVSCVSVSFFGLSAQDFTANPVSPGKGGVGEALLFRVPGTSSGITFRNELSDKTHTRNQITLNGSGVAAGDFDNDGLCDLYFSGLDSDNRLYRNLGNLKFEDVTEKYGVGMPGKLSTGVVWVDINGDYYPELLVNTIGQGTLMFINQGGKGFMEVTSGKGINQSRAGMSFAIGDLNGDSFPDVYITNYRAEALMDNPGTRFSFETGEDGRKRVSHVNGRPVRGTSDEGRYVINSQGSVIELGEPDSVYLNVAGRQFRKISFSDPLFRNASGTALDSEPNDWGLAARFGDLNGDGRTDLYVCNDFETPDRIWFQSRDGSFRLASESAFNRLSFFSMGVDFGDFNRDGLSDILVVDMLPENPGQRHNIMLPEQAIFAEQELSGPPQVSWNTLLQNAGQGEWMDVGPMSGLSSTGWSWCVAFQDLDLDGWEDVFVTNGVERDGRDIDVSNKLAEMRKSGRYSNDQMFDARKQFPTLNAPDLAYKNLGNGQFQKKDDWGFATEAVSHGMAFADLDNDGDLDIIVNHQNQEASIFLNTSGAPRVQFRLFNRPPNTRGLGAKIELSNGDFRYSHEITGGGRYLSHDQMIAVFPVPFPEKPISARVIWPDGSIQNLDNLKANSMVEVFNLEDKPSGNGSQDNKGGMKSPVSTAPLFTAGKPISFPSNDWFDLETEEFMRNQIAPYQISKLGTRISERRKSNGKHASLSFGGFSWRESENGIKWGRYPIPLDDSLSRSVVATDVIHTFQIVLRGLDMAGGGREASLAVYDQSDNNKRVFFHQWPKGLMIEPGPFEIADLNSDGREEIIVPVRWQYRKTSKPPGTYIFHQDSDGEWKLHSEWTSALQRTGPCFDIEIADINGDREKELILPGFILSKPAIYSFHSGKANEISSDLGLELPSGMWMCASAIDLDADASTPPGVFFGNYGMNNVMGTWQSAANTSFSFAMVAQEAAGGATRIFEAGSLQGSDALFPVALYSQLEKSFPILSRRISRRSDFSDWDIEKILSLASPSQPDIFPIERLGSALFHWDSGGGFREVALPAIVNAAPIRDVASGDFNGDGHVDILCAVGWDTRDIHEVPTSSEFPILLINHPGQDEADGNFFEPYYFGRSGLKTPSSTSDVSVMDVNGDGLPDVRFLTDRGALQLFINNSSTIIQN